MPRYANKIDREQPQLIKYLTSRGVFVWNTSGVGKDFPDLLTHYKVHTALIEFKSEDTPVKIGQMRFLSQYPGLCGLAFTEGQAFKIASGNGLSESEQFRLGVLANQLELDWRKGLRKQKQMTIKKVIKEITR